MRESWAAWHRGGAGAEWRNAVFTAVKGNWGIGMMAMPYMLDQAGFGTGLLLFGVANFLAWAGIMRMIQCREIIRRDRAHRLQDEDIESAGGVGKKSGHLDCPNYSDIVREILGDTGASVSMVSILIAMYGSNIA
jgi:amino acid permease